MLWDLAATGRCEPADGVALVRLNVRYLAPPAARDLHGEIQTALRVDAAQDRAAVNARKLRSQLFGHFPPEPIQGIFTRPDMPGRPTAGCAAPRTRTGGVRDRVRDAGTRKHICSNPQHVMAVASQSPSGRLAPSRVARCGRQPPRTSWSPGTSRDDGPRSAVVAKAKDSNGQLSGTNYQGGDRDENRRPRHRAVRDAPIASAVTAHRLPPPVRGTPHCRANN